MPTKRIVVVGGGITGLAAAYELAQARRAGAPVEEYLVEAGPRLGGALRTEQVDGCVVEAGADSFLAEKREAAVLCQELGLGPELIGSNDAQRKTYILHRGHLEPLPEGLEFFVPACFPGATSWLRRWRSSSGRRGKTRTNRWQVLSSGTSAVACWRTSSSRCSTPSTAATRRS